MRDNNEIKVGDLVCWVDRVEGQAPDEALDARTVEAAADPVEEYPEQLIAALGDLLLLGLGRADSQSTEQWSELRRRGEALGFDSLAAPVARIVGDLEQKTRSARWDSAPTAAAALELAVLARVARELAWESA